MFLRSPFLGSAILSEDRPDIELFRILRDLPSAQLRFLLVLNHCGVHCRNREACRVVTAVLQEVFGANGVPIAEMGMLTLGEATIGAEHSDSGSSVCSGECRSGQSS